MKNGDRITITYLPPCVNGGGDPNPYINMSGEVRDYDGKTFSLFTGTSWLVGIDYCRYRPTDIPKCGYFEKKEDVSVGRAIKCSGCKKYPYNIYTTWHGGKCAYCLVEKTHGKLKFVQRLCLFVRKLINPTI
jgi:hypothetical protein